VVQVSLEILSSACMFRLFPIPLHTDNSNRLSTSSNLFPQRTNIAFFNSAFTITTKITNIEPLTLTRIVQLHQYPVPAICSTCLIYLDLTLQSPMVTICTTSLTFSKSTFCPHSVFMCFVCTSEQKAIISLYSTN
jgi:hypothetical protein